MMHWAESFDHYGTGTTSTVRDKMKRGLWSDLNQFAGCISNGTARTGDHYFKALQSGSAGSGNNRRSVTSTGNLGLTTAVRLTGLPSTDSRNMIQWLDASNNKLLTMVFKPSGAIDIIKGDHLASAQPGTLLDTTDQVVTANSWHHMEAFVQISSTIGEIELRWNGIVISFLTDLNLGSTPIAQIQIPAIGSGTAEMHLDDTVAWDKSGSGMNDFLGQVRVHAAFLEADGTPFDWAISGTSAGYDAVNEADPDDDTSYIVALNVNDECYFPLPTLPSEVMDIEGIHIPFLAKSTDAGASRFQASLIAGASPGEEDFGQDHSITSNYTYWQDVFERNPDGNGKWTKTSFENGQLKITRTL